MPTKLVLAYLAGLVDGEGCIYVGKHFNHPQKKTRYRLRLQVTNTNKIIPEIFQQEFGGWIYQHNPKDKTWKVRYDWVISDKKAENVLKILLPYLLIKKQQVKLALTLRQKGSDKIKICEELHCLNRKGNTNAI